MAKILFVGDPHVVPNELSDCTKLMEFAYAKAKEHNAILCLLGDLYDKHGIVNLEVLDFWRNMFLQHAETNTIALVGNHDRIPFSSKHALQAHEKVIHVVDKPTYVHDILFMPYYDDRDKFVADCNANPTDIMVCHQSFQGAQYENGFFDPEGVDANAIPQKLVIAGHIHSPAKLGKVLYIGAPRWRNISDASVNARGLMLFDTETQKKKGIGLDGITSKIIHLVDTQDQPAVVPTNTSDRYRIDIYGTKEYCLQRKAALGGDGIRVNTFPQTTRTIAVRESEGIFNAFSNYLESYQPQYGTPKELLQNMCQKRLNAK